MSPDVWEVGTPSNCSSHSGKEGRGVFNSTEFCLPWELIGAQVRQDYWILSLHPVLHVFNAAEDILINILHFYLCPSRVKPNLMLVPAFKKRLRPISVTTLYLR